MRTAARSHRPGAIPILLLGLGWLAACGPKPAPEEGGKPGGGGSAGARGRDTLVIAVQQDASSFISVVQQSVWDGALTENLFLQPVASDFDCRIKYGPLLAETIEQPPDGLSITYKLNRSLTWSDGVPVTAKDIAFTYDLVADPKVASPRISYIEHMKPDARPRVLDEHTVRFEFTHAYDRYAQTAHTNLAIVPEHVLGKLDRQSLRATDFEKAPVVSGPWKIGKWEKNSSLTLVPNEAYKGLRPPTLARVIFKVIPEYASRLVELENGSVDMVETLQNMDDVARLKQTHPEIKLYRRGLRSLEYVGWNLRNPLFADRDVRQALTMAIDRSKLVKDLLTTPDGEALGKEAVSWITPELCDYRTDAITPIPFDPQKARDVLAAKGWKDSDGDGILDRDGQPFRFTLLTNAGNARREKASVILQSNLKEVGIDAQLARVETNNFFERLRKKDYEAALSGWSAGLFVDPIELWHSDSAERKYEFNFTGYSNPRADELMDRGMKLADPAEAALVWRELQQVIYDDQPYTFLFWRDDVVPLHGRFQGAKIDLQSFIHDLNTWWVPEDKVKYKF